MVNSSVTFLFIVYPFFQSHTIIDFNDYK